VVQSLTLSIRAAVCLQTRPRPIVSARQAHSGVNPAASAEASELTGTGVGNCPCESRR